MSGFSGGSSAIMMRFRDALGVVAHALQVGMMCSTRHDRRRSLAIGCCVAISARGLFDVEPLAVDLDVVGDDLRGRSMSRSAARRPRGAIAFSTMLP